MAACRLLDRRTQFDEGCTGWVDARIQSGRIMQPRPSEPVSQAVPNTYTPHTLEINYPVTDVSLQGAKIQSFMRGVPEISGTTWADTFDPDGFTGLFPFRYQHKDTLFAFDGYITSAEQHIVLNEHNQPVVRYLCEFVAGAEPYIIHPFHGGDTEIAVAQAKADKEEAQRKAEEERKHRLAEWTASQPDEDEYTPDYWD